MPFLTILTATYNRADYLPKVFESLKKQTDKDFEWIIIDDGSQDETSKIVKNWCDVFEIKYIYQENAGKMQAINNGIKYANGYMTLILDSDDQVTENAVEIIKRHESSIVNKSIYAGVAGQKFYYNGSPVGSTFSGEYIDCSSLERRKNGINGDKAEVFYTEVLRKYPFPFFKGEKFVPEALVWNRIANDGYILRWFNECIYYCEYLEDGYTQNVNSNLIRNWQGYSLYIKELLKSRAKAKEKIVPVLGYIYRFLLKTVKKY